MAVTPESTSARVSGSSAAMCRYVKRVRPGRRRGYSDAIGSFTLSRSSARSQTSSTEPIAAPARSYASSGNALPSPAPASTRTSWPRWTSSSAPAGVSATRYSCGLISLATPIRTARGTIAERPRPVSAAGEPPGGERRGEEPRIVGRPPAHVRERQMRARVLPVADVDLDHLEALRAVEPGRPGDARLAETEGQRRPGVVGEAAVTWTGVGERDAWSDDRRRAERRGDIRRLGDGEPAVTPPRPGADDAGPDPDHDYLRTPTG